MTPSSSEHLTELLDQLQDAQDDDAREWVVMQFSLEALNPQVRDAVWAAAIPHWFDLDFLTALLTDTPPHPNSDVESPPPPSSQTPTSPNSDVESPPPPSSQTPPSPTSGVESLPPHSLQTPTSPNSDVESSPPSSSQTPPSPTSGIGSPPPHSSPAPSLLNSDVESPPPHSLQTPPLPNWGRGPGGGVEKIFHTLTHLSFVEPFPGRGYNVHERSRELLLAHLWQEDRGRYRVLNARAAAYCAEQDQDDVVWRVETLYHQLLADTPGVVDAFVNQGIEWHNQFEYDKVEALVRPILEEIEAGRLTGRVAAWAYFLQARLDLTYSRYPKARAHLERSLAQHVDDQALEANALWALGEVHRMLDEYAEARGRYEAALAVSEAIGYRVGEANALWALGEVHRMLDEYAEARGRYEAALAVSEAIGSRLGEANALRALGDVHRMLGEYPAARGRYEAALAVSEAIGYRLGEANCYLGLGDLDRYAERWQDAEEKYQRALECYQETGVVFNTALALQRLGHTVKGAGDMALARAYYEEALALFMRIGSPEAEKVQADLEHLEAED